MLSLRQKLLLCSALSVIWFSGLFGQQYSFINFSIEDGLAQSQVLSIYQDPKGYLWMGTYGGLSRYDGKNFVNYSKEDGLIDNRINSITAGKKGEIYFATLGGINRYNGRSFTSLPLKDELSKNQVTSVAFDRNGNLWMGTDGGGVCMYNGMGFVYFSEIDGLMNDYVRSVCLDKNGNVWFGTRGGICYYDGKAFRKIDSTIAQPHNVSRIIEDKDKNLWFCSYGEGVFKYDPSAVLGASLNTFINYTESDGLIMDWIRDATQDAEGNFWFASRSGVSKFNGKTFLNFDEANGLFYSNINTVMQDKEGKVWFGTDGKGLLKFTGELFVNYTIQDGLSSDIVMSVTEDNYMNRWYGTYGNGVCRQDTSGKFTNYTMADGLNNNVIWTCYTDKDNKVWFGTSDGACYFENGKFTSLPDSLPANTVYSIFRDSKNNMWFGTTAGVTKYDGKIFTHYTDAEKNVGKNVRSIAEDKNHNLWFASSSGLYQYNGNQFKVLNADTSGLSDNNVVSVVIDSEQNVWAGTSNGITVFGKSGGSALDVDDKYSSNNINFLLISSDEHLWIGTNNGIYELDLTMFRSNSTTKFNHYTNYEGLRSLECNQNAAYEDKSGNLWFGTSDGILKYSPEQSANARTNPEPLTHITGVRLFLQPTDWSPFSDSIDDATQLPMHLSIDYKKKYLTFDYIGISLNNPGAVRYQFMLEGFDSDWSPVTDATFATYSNLPHGHYTFKVLACNKDGVWNTEPATFSFEITPPFWLTWWFFILAALTVGGLIYMIYRWRVSRIKEQHHTQQLEYQSRLLVLEHQTLNASMNRHFVFNALNSIQYYITKENKALATKYLSSFAKLIRKNLDSSMSNFVPLSEEIERLKLYLELEHMRLEGKFDYKIEIEGDLDTESIDIPPMMLQPYIENSIWHGILPMEKPGTIVINVKEMGDEIMFCIQDNGIGVEESKRRKAANGSLHVSRGMEITTGRINLLRAMTKSGLAVKGPFDVKNEKGETTGARVEIVLPIKA